MKRREAYVLVGINSTEKSSAREETPAKVANVAKVDESARAPREDTVAKVANPAKEDRASAELQEYLDVRRSVNESSKRWQIKRGWRAPDGRWLGPRTVRD
jgi:hypothetical protein